VWSDIRTLRDAVTPFLEKKREEKIIGASLDAALDLYTADADAEKILQGHVEHLGRVFVVSYDQVGWMDSVRPESETAKVFFTSLDREVEIRVCVKKAAGQKCVRCWNYSETVGKSSAHPRLCGKCLGAVGVLP
jgi:isoleucyl-tRNA synthetase